MVDTIKFSEMTDGGDLANNEKTPGLLGGANVLFNNPWTFLPPGTTAQRPAPSSAINYRLRFNTDVQLYEYYDAVLGAWTQLQESASTLGPFITYTADAGLPDAQNLGLLTTGILKQTVALGISTISIAANGTDYWAPGDALTRTQVPTVGNDVTNKTYVDGLISGTVASVQGTQFQVLSNGTFGTPQTGAITLTTPQDIAPTSSPTFAALTLTAPLTPANGGTGVNNGSSTLTLGGSLSTIGAFTAAFTMTGNTAVTFPTSGTLATTSSASGIVNAGSINQLAWYAANGTTVSGLATANDGVLITSAGGVPSIGSTLPTAVQGNITQLGAQSQALNMNTHLINNVVDPVSLQDAATKNYVDSVAQGRSYKDPCVAASTVALTATYNNGASGVGATLTNAGALAAISLDGVSPTVGQRVLIKNQASSFQNGIYTVTTVGSGAVAWVLTRAVDMDVPSEFIGGTTYITGGTTQISNTWTENLVVTTVGTDPVNFILTGAGSGSVTSITAGQGITLTPSPITTTGSVALTVLPINPNTIIGGNFDTNPWQRGTSFTAPTTGTYTADRFAWIFSGAGVVNVLKTADAPTVVQAGIFVQNCLHTDVTTADASIGASDVYMQEYRVEGYDWAQLAQRACTLTFWVKAAKTGIHCVGIRNFNLDRYYIQEYTIAVADTWQLVTISIPASPSAGTWNYTNGVGLVIDFVLACGSTLGSGTAGSWQTGNMVATTNQVNEMDNTANNFKIDLVKLEAGSTATPWEVRSEEVELALCQRYYSKSYNVGTAIGSATAVGAIYSYNGAASANAGGTAQFKTKMRGSPTFTSYDLAGNINKITIGATDNTAVSTAAIGETSASAANNSGTSGIFSVFHYTASAEL